MPLKDLIVFSIFFQVHFVAKGQSIFDDCEIYTKWTQATIVLKSNDTIISLVKYNPMVNAIKIELKKQEDFSSIPTETVKELFYFDSNIDTVRRFKNIQIYFMDLQRRMDVFSEIYFDNEYFAITRSVSYVGYPSLLNPLGKPSYQLAVYTIDKMTGRPFKDQSKKTFIKAMSDKEAEIKKCIKENRLKLYAIDDEIKIFKYYATLKR